jgi:hypothetical protein
MDYPTSSKLFSKKKAPGIYFPGLKKINPGRTGSGPSGVSQLYSVIDPDGRF